MIDTRCGLKCQGCGWIETDNCGGCIATNGNPFHGECPVAQCCQGKGLLHCGDCNDIPCELLTQYSCDPAHGDTPARARIEQCREWAKLERDIKLKAAELLNNCNQITIASINDSGFPRVCVLSKLKNESFHTAYFSTGLCSEKVKHFIKNPNSSVCYYSGGNSVTLIGKTEIVDDMEIKKEIWQEWLINHFPRGTEDPNYCVLKFTATIATLWIDSEFLTINT
ncbi:MAG TPA: hypothetical protein DCP51_06950 [Clostridiales bacterium]|nr:hypothetical protein [Clostridiales bacterium]